jgi:hypothetical protein
MPVLVRAGSRSFEDRNCDAILVDVCFHGGGQYVTCIELASAVATLRVLPRACSDW